MSEMAKLTDKIDKLSELVEKVAVVIVRQDAHDEAMDEVKQEVKALQSDISQMKIDVAVAKESARNHEEMSKRTNDSISAAIKWGAGIAATLIVAGVIGTISALSGIS